MTAFLASRYPADSEYLVFEVLVSEQTPIYTASVAEKSDD